MNLHLSRTSRTALRHRTTRGVEVCEDDSPEKDKFFAFEEVFLTMPEGNSSPLRNAKDNRDSKQRRINFSREVCGRISSRAAVEALPLVGLWTEGGNATGLGVMGSRDPRSLGVREAWIEPIPRMPMSFSMKLVGRPSD